ncbi:hypothetical protein [Marinobacter gelidimuriae]|uniref:hypothetical protein n=1 Tax=Marinobacter gelidimuriae TaxID=2739064 RepID=UPI00037F1826|nr:hypothetical protein [Marinobacter gelidimuriae]
MKNELIHTLTESFESHAQETELGKGGQREITTHNAREQTMHHEPHISQEHVANNEAVRQTLLGRGIRPENLPPDEDVKKAERRLTSAEKKAIDNLDGLEEQ